MEYRMITDILSALEEITDYVPMLERQDQINQTMVKHSLQMLETTFTNYQRTLFEK